MTEADVYLGAGSASGSGDPGKSSEINSASSGITMGGLVGLAEQSALSVFSEPTTTSTDNAANGIPRKRSLAPAPLYPAMGPKLPIIGGGHPTHSHLTHRNYLRGGEEDDFGIGREDPYTKRANHGVNNNAGGNGNLVFGIENAEDLALTADDSDDDYGGTGSSRSNSVSNPHHHGNNGNINNPQGSRAGRRKIKIEFIDDKSRRHITFSKRKAGIMKKVLLLVASETGHVYTFATPKLQPLITKPEGKNLIQACLNAPEPGDMLAGGLVGSSTTNNSTSVLSVNSSNAASVSSSANQSRSNSVSQLEAQMASASNSATHPHPHTHSHSHPHILSNPLNTAPNPNGNSTSLNNNANYPHVSQNGMPLYLNNLPTGPYHINTQMGAPPPGYSHISHNNNHHNQSQTLPYIDPYGELTSNNGHPNYGPNDNSRAAYWLPPAIEDIEHENDNAGNVPPSSP